MIYTVIVVSDHHLTFFPHRYKPPTALPEDEEQIFIEKVLLSDATLKREIYVLSDLHLGGQWIKDNVQKIKDFLFPLAKVAERFVHAIVLLGDVFEMWMTPISMTPPSPKELAKTWKEDKVCFTPLVLFFAGSVIQEWNYMVRLGLWP